MYHLSKVERYEPRLECMAYMGNFDDLLIATQPVSFENPSPQIGSLDIFILSVSLCIANRWCSVCITVSFEE